MYDIITMATPLPIDKIKSIAQDQFGTMVKAVVDIERRIMAIGGEMHADEEDHLLSEGSKPENLWGINIYPGLDKENRIEFDSMINIRPAVQNRSRNVENPETRNKITEIVHRLLVE